MLNMLNVTKSQSHNVTVDASILLASINTALRVEDYCLSKIA